MGKLGSGKWQPADYIENKAATPSMATAIPAARPIDRPTSAKTNDLDNMRSPLWKALHASFRNDRTG
jgi:hypothetical protein